MHQTSLLRHTGFEYIQSCLDPRLDSGPIATISDSHLIVCCFLIVYFRFAGLYQGPIPGTWSSEKPLCSCLADTIAHDKSSMGEDGGAKEMNVVTIRWLVHETNLKATCFNCLHVLWGSKTSFAGRDILVTELFFAAAVMLRARDRRLICERNLFLQYSQHEISSCFLRIWGNLPACLPASRCSSDCLLPSTLWPLLVKAAVIKCQWKLEYKYSFSIEPWR